MPSIEATNDIGGRSVFTEPGGRRFLSIIRASKYSNHNSLLPLFNATSIPMILIILL